jgi:hypothetical protein
MRDSLRYIERKMSDKKRKRSHDKATASSLQLCGFEPTSEYLEVLRDLDGASICPPGRKRPSSADAIRLYAPHQGKRHRLWSPPGFDNLKGISEPDVFLEISKGLDFPLSALEPRLEPDVEAAIDHIVKLGPGRIGVWRFDQRALIRRCVVKLEPLSAAMRAVRLPHIAWAGGPVVSIAMVCALVDHEEWPDRTFPRDQFMAGVQLVGEASATGLWCPKPFPRLKSDRDKAIPLGVFHRQHAMMAGKTKRIVEKRAAAAAGHPDRQILIQAIFEASMAEIAAGTAAGPFTYSYLDSRFGYGKHRPLVRSVVERNGKYRAVDNGRETTKAVVDSETLGMMHPNFPVAVGRRFFAKLRDAHFPWRMGGSKDDETAAYKKTPTITPEFTPAVIANPVTGKAMVIMPQGLNFGHGLAGRQYSRKPCFISGMARRFFAAPIDHYIDDVTAIEPDFAAGPRTHVVPPRPGREFPRSSQAMLWDFCEDLHLADWSSSKSVSWRPVVDPIGMVTDFSSLHNDGLIRVSIKPSTCAKVHDEVVACLSSGRINPKLASKIVGKFRWVACLGKIGLAATQPLIKLANGSHNTEVKIRDDVAIKSALSLIASLTDGSLPPALFSDPDFAPPILIFSDASWNPRPPLLHGSGQVAFIIIRRGVDGSEECLYSATEVPQDILFRIHDLRAQKTLICPLEELAMAAPFMTPELKPMLKGRDVLHFADNQGANCVAIKGYSSAPDLARVVSAVHFRIAQLQVRWWIAFVPSAANPADAPSRGDFTALIARGARRLDFVFPSLESWTD